MFNGKLTIMESVTSQSIVCLLFNMFIGCLRFMHNGLWWTNLNEYALNMTNTLIRLYTSFITLVSMFVEHLCCIGVFRDQCKDS